MKYLLRKLADLVFTNSNLEPLVEAVEQNIELLDSLNIDWNTPIRCGANGCIFETASPDWVIKLTIDPHETRLFETIRDENIKSGFVKVGAIYALHNNTYIIEKQKIIPLDSLPLDETHDYITAKYMNFMHVYYQEMNDVSQGRKSIAAAISIIRKHTFNQVVDIFISLRKLAYSGKKLMDIDLDNVGYADNNQLVIFDAQIEPLK